MTIIWWALLIANLACGIAGLGSLSGRLNLAAAIFMVATHSYGQGML